MQYKIPQNVRIEDKIVAGLTLKQLLYLGVGGGVTYVIYTVLAQKYFIEVWIWFVAPPALLTLAITFVKVRGIPFMKWVFLLVEYFVNPRKRTFVMGAGDMYSATIFAKKKDNKPKTAAQEKKALSAQEKLEKIGEISKTLDQYGHSTP